VRDVGDARVGHDRRRIRVHEDGLDALLAQRAAGLRARVVELRGLADEDWAAPDDEDFHRSIACPSSESPTAVARATSVNIVCGSAPGSTPAPLRLSLIASDDVK